MIILHWIQATSCGKPSYSLLILYLSYDFFPLIRQYSVIKVEIPDISYETVPLVSNTLSPNLSM